MKNLFPVLAFLLLGISGCAPQVDVEAEQAALRELPLEWARAANAKDVERMVALYAEDALVMPPNAPLAAGPGAIRALWSQMVETPGFSSSNQTTQVEISRAGEMAYSVGRYELTRSAEGQSVTDRGKWVVVWKKQADGRWKVVADIWNSDQAAPTAAPTPPKAAQKLARPGFAVQIGAYENRVVAEALAQNLSVRYQRTALVAPVVARGKTLYRVRIPVETKAEADALAKRIRAEQELKTMVIPLP